MINRNETTVSFSNMERNVNLSLSVEETNSVNEESDTQPHSHTATTEDNEEPTIVYRSEIILETTTEENKEKNDKDDSDEEGSNEEITVIDEIETHADDNTSLDTES